MTFNAFDPYAMLAEQAAPAAKPAKDAKVDDAAPKTLADLATLAEQHAQFHNLVAADWQEFFDERAGIAEHCGQMPRDKAERMAYESCISRWLDTHLPAHTNDAICPYCQHPNGAPGISCVPTLSGDGGHLWLHRACHEPWRARRRQETINALANMGIIRQWSSVTTASTPGGV